MSTPKPTRLLVIASNFAPELTGIGKYVGEMTVHMAEAGIDVRVVTAPPYYPAWSVQPPYRAFRYTVESRAGARVYRCPLYVPRRAGGLARLLHLGTFAVTSLPVMLGIAVSWRPNIVMVVEPPLACAPAALLAARLARARTWLHVQDFEVDAAFGLGVLQSSWLRRCALKVESWLMRRFDRASSISRRMEEKLWAKGVSHDRTFRFPNWVDTSQIRPASRQNALRTELGIDTGTRVLLYSGNMGEKQGLDLLLDVAARLDHDPQVLLLICGDGAARPRLERLAADMSSVRFLPLQPLERLNELLALADIHLLPQRAGVEDLVLPSKLTAILASGRPLVACAAPDSDLGIAAASGGLVVPAGDPDAFASAVRDLLDDDALCERLGLAGRAYALANLDRSAVLDELFVQLRAMAATN